VGYAAGAAAAAAAYRPGCVQRVNANGVVYYVCP
jgi:hypothetical protein